MKKLPQHTLLDLAERELERRYQEETELLEKAIKDHNAEDVKAYTYFLATTIEHLEAVRAEERGELEEEPEPEPEPFASKEAERGWKEAADLVPDDDDDSIRDSYEIDWRKYAKDDNNK